MKDLSPRAKTAGLGFLVGLVLVVFLPTSWLFTEGVAARGHHGEGAQYACPMFCVVMDEMPDDGRCPVCGMELAEVSGESKLSPAERHMVGLEADALARVPLASTLRVVGEVDYDEGLVSRVTTRAAGWLTEVHVEARWATVERGDPLISIYSPDVFAAQQEYLVALGGEDETLRETARRRLALLGVAETEIDAIRSTRRAADSVLLRAPRRGVVVERKALPGAAVQRGEVLVTVADLSRVWIQAEVYERDLPHVRVGQPVRLVIPATGRRLEGAVAFIDPAIEGRTRTARVRIEAGNTEDATGARPFRIGQRVDAWIEARIDDRGEPVAPGAAPDRDPLALPRSAVLRTGERTVVYALFTEMVPGKRDYRLDPGNLPETVLYEMIPVRVGAPARRSGDADGEEFYPVVDAGPLPEGAVVVTKGNLLIDSQAQLSGKPSLLFPEGNRGGGGGPHSGH